jgi:uncharacterized membrane protein YedE/YeeE
MIASIVDTHALLQVIWVSLIAGVGVPSCYALAILGSTRAIELGRNGRPAEAAVFAVLGFLGLAVVVGSIVFGILTLLKD